ncbi:MAG: rRNA-processing protein bfr2 [Caeruleum heppii]|nr:MAG: rRNA-processing protein bfr2 [Caeruleum heppii]
MKKPKTLAEQIADLDDPTPRDFDPEQHEEAPGSAEESGSEGGDKTHDGREHYLDVGKSKLRKLDEATLGPQYQGSRISRDALLDEDDEDDPFAPRDGDSQGSEDSDVEASDAVEMGVGDGDEEIDSDEAFGEGDIEKFKAFTFRKSGVNEAERSSAGHKNDEMSDGGDSKDSDVNSEDEDPDVDQKQEATNGRPHHSDLDSSTSSGNFSADDDEDSEGSTDDIEDDDEDDDKQASSTDRAALREMMATSQTSVLASLSQAAKADAAKGNAVKHQRRTFDTLLNTRIRLQKGLVAANSLPIALSSSADPRTASNGTELNGSSTLEAAEQAALNLWNQITEVRNALPSSSTPSLKRKRSGPATTTTPLSELQAKMTELEASALPTRNAVLEKWSKKARGTTTLPLAGSRLNNTARQQGITDVLGEQLTGATFERHLERARRPRGSALTSSSTAKHPPPSSSTLAPPPLTLYDDSAFYALLLKDLVDQRMDTLTTTSSTVPTNNNPNPSLLVPPLTKLHRPNLDTKASKGRKMRYTVHEKLQNFMAPVDGERWGPRQREELFAGLLGRRVGSGVLDERDDGDEDGGERDGRDKEEEEALRLFRS